jgi:hypothetical protein
VACEVLAVLLFGKGSAIRSLGMPDHETLTVHCRFPEPKNTAAKEAFKEWYRSPLNLVKKKLIRKTISSPASCYDLTKQAKSTK